jgi:hypothetical protein
MSFAIIVFDSPLHGALCSDKGFATSETFDACLDGHRRADNVVQVVSDAGCATVVNAERDGVRVEGSKASLGPR